MPDKHPNSIIIRNQTTLWETRKLHPGVVQNQPHQNQSGNSSSPPATIPTSSTVPYHQYNPHPQSFWGGPCVQCPNSSRGHQEDGLLSSSSLLVTLRGHGILQPPVVSVRTEAWAVAVHMNVPSEEAQNWQWKNPTLELVSSWQWEQSVLGRNGGGGQGDAKP